MDSSLRNGIIIISLKIIFAIPHQVSKYWCPNSDVCLFSLEIIFVENNLWTHFFVENITKFIKFKFSHKIHKILIFSQSSLRRLPLTNIDFLCLQ